MARGTPEQIKEALRLHELWFDNESEGKQFDISDYSLDFLQGADLEGAFLLGANLEGADLEGAYLERVTGNGREIKSINGGMYPITYTEKVLSIGCQQHPLADWLRFTDEEKANFAQNSLKYLNKWLPILDSMGVFDPVKEKA